MEEERLSKIKQRWFLQEGALFAVLCVHEFVSNSSMSCPMRCGQGRIEYNPEYIREISDEALESLLKVEAIRILLKHPYMRYPTACSRRSSAIGSNITISDNYGYLPIKLDKASDYGLDRGKAYEWYARRIEQQSENSDTESEKGDLADLWGENPMIFYEINDIIKKTTNWGSLRGDFVEKLQASTHSSIDWRNVLNGFRLSVLTSEKKLTRMKPNRRTGFQNMGSTRNFTTRILIAVDTSGSIGSEELRYFYGVINSAFKYGVETVDVIQFDTEIRSKCEKVTKKISSTLAIGRGGTSFQPPIDYAIDGGYEGLVILTDGDAPQPKVPVGAGLKILWVCDSQFSYNRNSHWMQKLGRVCTMQLN